MSMFERKRRGMPGLNTASLPDLIFTVLFFFMIVTHMREVPVKVQYKVPQGSEVEKLTKKSTVSYIYIGKPAPGLQRTEGTGTRIQLNDKFATVDEVGDYIAAERERMAPGDVKKMTVSIRADENTHMGIITDVKQALRQSRATKINYSAVLPQE